MVILLSFGTKVFKKAVLEYGFPLLEYFRRDGKILAFWYNLGLLEFVGTI